MTGRNERGDSIYLVREDATMLLRVSNHRRTPKQRRVHREVVASLVLDQPIARERIAERVAAAVRSYIAARPSKLDNESSAETRIAQDRFG